MTMKSSMLGKDKKREGNIAKNVKILFRLQNEINDTTIKEARNLFRLKKEIDDTTLKHVKSPARLKKENKAIKSRIIRNHY